MTYSLRQYQSDAVDAGLDALKSGLNPVIQLPTGSGKSLVGATIAQRLAQNDGRIIVMAHVKELVEQNAKTFKRFAPEIPMSICCAGLNQNDTSGRVVFGSIQTMFRRGKEEHQKGLDLVIVDECHMVPNDGDGLMYTTFLKDCNARTLGMSATPWRLDGGSVIGEGRYFDATAFQVGAIELVNQGYLSALVGVDAEWQLDTSKIKKTAGDFNTGQVNDAIKDEWLDKVLPDVLKRTRGRKHGLIFCPTIESSKKVSEWLIRHKESASYINADSKDRDEKIDQWKAGDIRWMTNVDILTTGFDFPALDCIISLRPTQSSALWVQMLGRGMRLADGKENCMVLDYVGNLSRLGGVDTLESWTKVRDKKETAVEPNKKAEDKADPPKERKPLKLALQTIDPMLGRPEGIMVDVLKTSYIIRPSARQPGKNLLLVNYECETNEGLAIDVTQFVCNEYTGGARWHAEQWAKRRGYTRPSAFPKDAKNARMECYALPTPRRLQVRRVEGHMNVIKEVF